MCFSAFSLSRPRWHAVRATHLPRRPKKKPLRGKKVGFAEKNFAYRKQLGIVRIKGGISLPDGFTPQSTEAHRFGFGGLQAALGFASLAWSCPQYAISDGNACFT